MESKTAMQELIEYLNKDYEWFVNNSPEHGVIPQIIKKATQLLAKERQQIIDAYKVGFSFGEDIPDKHTNFMATDYFTQKYKQ